ncbi:hypothetical protein GCM10009609_27020 [Pseudonocardia aurantiaca]|uniref:Uncharacterized protein n=1 Tax=Pseudonocardia aurantiaca TaxID=75290 RepID=A0ABW4FHB9_9PSEU
MTRLTFTIGGILTVLGIVAYVATGAVSVTALIPAFVGVLLLVCAALARRPALHRYSIHGALVIALLGAAGSLMNVVKLGDLFAGTAQRPSAIVLSTIMFVLLVFYIAMGVRSIIVARRSPAPTQRF